MFSLLLSAASLALPAALAQVTPTSPDGSTVVKVGDDISALWTADSTGAWKNMEIQLMTGPNLDMVALTVLGQNIDGTSTTSFSAPAPDVSPYSQIYFLQFTEGGDVTTATWSTRFTIAGADGSSTPPTNTTNWNGQDVQWGTGVLLGEATSSNSTSSSQSNTGEINAVASPSPSSGSSIMPSGSVSEAMSASMSASVSASASASASGSTTSSAPSSAQTSGGAGKSAQVAGGALVLALAGWLL